ncbi:hypothetical protein OESDEN_02764 [Oesophagostomum dentatum]|uniref:Uncharacterized protein n=1 Tax=Oesophagostomum dentatum TaxID=61180 RepID=A0A0B1TME3_OESDE|nr:hypothetical protein OESDEN_02764 [Oesophagostomum dentatum]
MAAPTFPPPVDVFRRSSMPETSSPLTRTETSTRNSVYPSRFIRPSSSSSSQMQPTPSTSVQVPQSDPIAITSSRQPLPSTFNLERQFMPQTQKESIFTTKLPSGEEQRITARVFHEEAAPPPKIAVKAAQASPLRIRSIDSRTETTTPVEMETRRRGEELREVMEQHRQVRNASHIAFPFFPFLRYCFLI